MIKNSIVFSILLILISLAWNHFVPEKLTSPAMPFIVVYFFISTVFTHQFLIKVNKQSAQGFVRAYLGTTTFRIFLNLIVIIAYMLIDRTGAMAFSLSFLAFYFLFLIFEIISLQKDLKKK